MNKKIIFLLLLSLMAFAGCVPSGSDIVLIVPKTKSYHLERCAKVMMAKVERVTRTEAGRLQYKACPFCKPDAL